jgi:hypothetical protein
MPSFSIIMPAQDYFEPATRRAESSLEQPIGELPVGLQSGARSEPANIETT